MNSVYINESRIKNMQSVTISHTLPGNVLSPSFYINPSLDFQPDEVIVDQVTYFVNGGNENQVMILTSDLVNSSNDQTVIRNGICSFYANITTHLQCKFPIKKPISGSQFQFMCNSQIAGGADPAGVLIIQLRFIKYM